MNNAPRERRKISLNSAVRNTAWSHQKELSALVGKAIHVACENNVTFQGTLVAADQFTIKISPTSPKLHSSVVIFKSAMTYFSEISKDKSGGMK